MSSSNKSCELPVRAVRVEFGNHSIRIALEDERVIEVPLAWYPRLEFATPEELTNKETFGDGASIYWPDLDEELKVDDVLMGRRSLEGPGSLGRWQSEMMKRRTTNTKDAWGREVPLPS